MTNTPDLRYTPFIAHYTDDDDKQVPRHFATNAEAHAFRRTLVDGRLPAKAEPKTDAPKVEPQAPADPVKAAISDKPALPPVKDGMIAKTEPAPKEDANPPVPAAGRP